MGEVTGAGAIRYSVIVPAYNSARHLPSCIDSILAAAGRTGGVEIIVMDNGSTDGSVRLLADRYAESVRVSVAPGVSISRLRNQGARLASGGHLVFIDSDCTVCGEYFEELDRIVAGPDPDATGARYRLPPDPSPLEETWSLLHRRGKDGPVRYLNGGNLVVRRKAFESTGGFLDSLRTGEDAEFGQRLRRGGHRILEFSSLGVAHHGNAKTWAGFYRKQVWHGLGMLGTARAWEPDLPLLMTGVHGALVGVSVLYSFAGPGPVPLRAGAALLLCLTVPAAAVAYRRLQGGEVRGGARALALYGLYFTARLHALLRIAAAFSMEALRGGWNRLARGGR